MSQAWQQRADWQSCSPVAEGSSDWCQASYEECSARKQRWVDTGFSVLGAALQGGLCMHITHELSVCCRFEILRENVVIRRTESLATKVSSSLLSVMLSNKPAMTVLLFMYCCDRQLLFYPPAEQPRQRCLNRGNIFS